MPKRRKDKDGLRCRNCNCGDTRVVQTDLVGSGDHIKIRRRRECRHCGVRFSTLEAYVDESPPKEEPEKPSGPPPNPFL